MPDSEHTRDLIDAARNIPGDTPLPGEDPDDPEAGETRTRRRGQLHYVAGITVSVLTIIIVLALLAIDSLPFADDPPKIALGLLMLVILMNEGTLLATLGAGEKDQRPVRASVRQASRIAVENAARIETATRQNADLIRLMTELLEQTKRQGERIQALEKVVEKVPRYPEAVLDGFDLGRGMTGNDGRP